MSLVTTLTTGASTPGAVNVDSNFNLLVNLPTNEALAGYVVPVGLSSDPGATAPVRRAFRMSPDARLRVGIDNLLWHDTFNHTVQDSGAYAFNTTTFTITNTAATLLLNGGNVSTASAVARINTYRSFQIFDSGAVQVDFRFKFANALVAHTVMEFGLAAGATGIALPTDGIYFKFNGAGQPQAVLNFNGSETAQNLVTTFALGVYYHLTILIDQDRAEFYVNGVLDTVMTYASASVPSTTQATAWPVHVRLFNDATGGGLQQVYLAEIAVASLDTNMQRPWSVARAGMAENSVTVPRGTAVGSTANYVNSTIPTSATLSNTAAGYATLGGQWQFAAVAGAETDYALFAYQIPVSAANGGNRNLVVTGVHIGCFNMGAAVATTPTLLQWAVGVGSTAVSLATADSATAGTRAPRKLAIGSQSLPIAAAIGANVPDLDIQFNSPLYVEAGTFFHIILKMPVGTATASQIIRGTCSINGFYE